PTGHRRGAAPAGEARWDQVGVADDDPDVLERDADLVGGDLGGRRLDALAVRHLARVDDHDAVLGELHAHLLAGPGHGLARVGPGRRLDVRRGAETEIAALGTRLRLSRPERRDVDHLLDTLERLAHRHTGEAPPGDHLLVAFTGHDVAHADLERLDAELA